LFADEASGERGYEEANECEECAYVQAECEEESQETAYAKEWQVEVLGCNAYWVEPESLKDKGLH